MDAHERKATSPWVYAGIGCLGAIVLGVGTCAGTGFFLGSKFKEIGAELQDPKKQEKKVLEILGASSLPDGYFALVGMSVPMLMEMAVLTDQPPPTEGTADRAPKAHGFWYSRMIDDKQQKPQAVLDYCNGTTDDPSALRRFNLNVGGKEIIKRGTIESTGQNVCYLSQRGEMSSRESGKISGIHTLLVVSCAGPADGRQRLGLWFGPDPAPDRPLAPEELTGTPADEAAISAFMAHFRLCGS